MIKNNVLLFLTFLFLFLIVDLLNIIFYTYPEQTNSKRFTDIVYNVDTEEVKKELNIKLVTVNYNGKIQSHLTRSYSPVTALIDLGYSVSNMNRITSISPISELHNNSYILVQSYTSTIDEIVYEIPYKTIIKGSTLCQQLSPKVKEQEGVLGLMLKRVKRIYRGNELIAEEILEESVQKEARAEIIVIKGPDDSPASVPQIGYNCTYWHAYVDGLNATAEEKQWLKFVMKWESGCNAENNKGFYKGLFQWSPCIWYKQWPYDNIFDGRLQIKRALEKLRNGTDPNNVWPAVHRKYVAKYGELSWLR